MKEFIRKWLGIAEILHLQQTIEYALRGSEYAHRDLIKELKKLHDLKLEEHLDKLNENTNRVNKMTLELKGIVAISRALIDKGKTKPT